MEFLEMLKIFKLQKILRPFSAESIHASVNISNYVESMFILGWIYRRIYEVFVVRRAYVGRFFCRKKK